MTFDKFVLNQYLRAYGVSVAESLLIRRGSEHLVSDDDVLARIGVPCFVKPANDGSSFGVSKVTNIDHLAPALRKAMMESDEVMVEAFLDGTEITCGCYKKYNGQVDEITPARIPEQTAQRVRELTSAIYDILHCNGIIRIDYILTRNADGTDKINMLEVNTTPGMTPTSFIPQQVRAAGLDIKDVLTEIVENQF